MGSDARGPEHMTGDESGGPEIQISLGEEPVFALKPMSVRSLGRGPSTRPQKARPALEQSPKLWQVRCPEYCPTVDLGHVRHDYSSLLTRVRIRQRSSLHGCRQCSLGFQT